MRPDCLAAASAMRCQRSRLLGSGGDAHRAERRDEGHDADHAELGRLLDDQVHLPALGYALVERDGERRLACRRGGGGDADGRDAWRERDDDALMLDAGIVEEGDGVAFAEPEHALEMAELAALAAALCRR